MSKEWISCKDRLPTNWMKGYEGRVTEYVIVWYCPWGTTPEEKEDIRLARMFFGHWELAGGHGNFDDDITHWMPKPTKPE